MIIAAIISGVLGARSRTVLIAALAVCGLNASPASAGPERLAHAPVFDITRPPIGWIEFCARQPNECARGTMTPREVVLTQNRWSDLAGVNKLVNETIEPLTDLEHWGIAEFWSYPDDGYGDCEDYVLMKRRMLMQMGWPREALLITTVLDKNGEAHAVLTLTSDKGDYVLDNQNEHILLWWKTGYRFVKRQSRSDPNVWVSLGNTRPAIATATSR